MQFTAEQQLPTSPEWSHCFSPPAMASSSESLISPSVELVFVREGEDESAAGEDQKLHIKRDVLMKFDHFKPALEAGSFAEGKTHRIVIREIGIDVARVVLQKDVNAMLNGLTEDNFLDCVKALDYVHSGISDTMVSKLDGKMLRRNWLEDPLFARQLIESMTHDAVARLIQSSTEEWPPTVSVVALQNPQLLKHGWNSNDSATVGAASKLLSYICHHLASGKLQASADGLARFLVIPTNSPTLSDAIGGVFADREHACKSKTAFIHPFRVYDAPLYDNPFVTAFIHMTLPRLYIFTRARVRSPSLAPPPAPGLLDYSYWSIRDLSHTLTADGEKRMREIASFEIMATATATEASRPSACACYTLHATITTDPSPSTSWGDTRASTEEAREEEGGVEGRVTVVDTSSSFDGVDYAVMLLGSNLGLSFHIPSLTGEELDAKGVGDVLLKDLEMSVTVVSYPYMTIALLYLRQCILQLKWPDITNFAKALPHFDRDFLLPTLAGISFRPFAAVTAWGMVLSKIEASSALANVVMDVLQKPVPSTAAATIRRSDMFEFILTVMWKLDANDRSLLAARLINGWWVSGDHASIEFLQREKQNWQAASRPHERLTLPYVPFNTNVASGAPAVPANAAPVPLPPPDTPIAPPLQHHG
ncbi:unnamed protein product [Vitrella brassicaformis CCMP3155]|uniref:Uncharacterized protein n=2 Tax=Vitrella brassicaformis TaxID=1169539 RepID=A0A0G4GXR8_VITBC|nr:unnamed protein product [Vitrella brassicaformis CCMP3155]|eukprot:CEM35924.1 unnamed protein product [Vitrella brassicaformis CCMP3155]